jgi:hypothetical protein
VKAQFGPRARYCAQHAAHACYFRSDANGDGLVSFDDISYGAAWAREG